MAPRTILLHTVAVAALLGSWMSQHAEAISAYPGLLTETQPDGTVIQLLAKGTENLHWRTDMDGYPVVRDPATPEIGRASCRERV